MYTLNKSYRNTKKNKTFTVQECSLVVDFHRRFTLVHRNQSAHTLEPGYRLIRPLAAFTQKTL